MARFDFYANPIADQRRVVPYWLDIQSDFVDAFATRVIVPLLSSSAAGAVTGRLNPQFDIEGRSVFAETQNMTAVPLRLLKKPAGSLRAQQAVIEDAIDFLFRGY
jgi:toxin CcdB